MMTGKEKGAKAVSACTARGIALACALLAAIALMMLAPTQAFAETSWNVSKSKTATNLDENFESQVTLSLPSAEEQLVSDVVFVLDKSTSADLEAQALEMLADLKGQIEETGAQVKVGVVIFNKQANTTGFMDLATQYDEIETAIKQEIKSGTNSHAGLLAGKEMLDSDSSVSADRKYLIFVSDGITYMYGEEPTVTAWSFKADTVLNWAGPDNWSSKYGSTAAPEEGWDAWLSQIGTQIESQGTTYEYPYGGTVVEATPVEEQGEYANSIDKALYLTHQVYTAAKSEGYHCYAMTAGTNADYPWATSFMEFLAGGESISFDQIQNDIYYLLDAGSTVEDYMGYVAGDDGYDFDFVNDAAKLTLTVGDESYAAEKIGDNAYGFAPTDGDYLYTVEYTRGNGADEEHFTWTINAPVSNFAPVQLTYSVVLTNPQTEAGTYGTFDADGSEGYAGLYTNSSATLYPVASDGSAGGAEDFAKPTVSYTVEAAPAVPDEPTDEPASGDDGSTVPVKEKVELVEDAATLPATGDSLMSLVPFAAVATVVCAAVIGFAVFRGARS